MTRRDRWVVALLVLVAALGVSACGGTAQSPVATSPVVVSPSASAAPSVATASAGPSGSGGPATGPASGSPAFVPDSPVAGVVTAVQMSGATTITGFTLHTNDGETVVFKIGVLQNVADFPASQLKDYETTGAPILVFFNQTGSDLVVFRIEDAG